MKNKPDTKRFVADSLSTGVSIMLLLTVLQRCIGFARQILTCRLMEPDELGRWNLAFSLVLLAAPLLVLGIPGTFGRYTDESTGQAGQAIGRSSRTAQRDSAALPARRQRRPAVIPG